MTPDITVRWILDADLLTIRADIATAANSLRTLLSDPPDDPELTDKVIRRVLRICSEAGPGELSKSETLKLMYPVGRYLETEDRIGTYQTELATLASARPELIGSAATAALFTEGDVSTARAATFANDHEISGNTVDFENPQEVFAELERFVISGEAIPTQFAEAVYGNDDLWLSTAATAFADAVSLPLSPEHVGLSASVLLNSRLRFLRPRIFLRFPAVLIAEELGARTNWDDIRRETMDLIAEPLLRTAGTIDSEINRPDGGRPRKTAFSDLRTHLETVIALLGYDLIRDAGEPVHFDPDLHLSPAPLDPESLVSVRRPGLRNVDNGQAVVKALVEPALDAEERE